MSRPGDPGLSFHVPRRDEADESWRTSSVRPDDVNRRLNGLWHRLEGPKPRRLSGVRDQESVEEAVPGDYARTNTFNLLTCARSAGQAERAAEVIVGTGTFFPTRAISLFSDPMLDRRTHDETPEGEELLVRVALPEAGRRSGRIDHFESVTIVGGPRAIGSPSSTVFPLCMHDLPTVLWWTSDIQYDLGVFRDLLDGSDQAIVDSALFGDIDRTLTELATVAALLRYRSVPLIDLTWIRSRDWRNLVAHFFDAPPAPDAIHAINAVSIEYVADSGGPGRPAGMSAALHLVGWLASRLGWELTDPPARTPDGLRLLFTNRYHPWPVVVRLAPVNGEIAPSGLRSVSITTAGERPGRFRVEQTDDLQLMTRSDVADLPTLARHVIMSATRDAALLDDAFRSVGRDDVYEEALTTTAAILARRQATGRTGASRAMRGNR